MFAHFVGEDAEALLEVPQLGGSDPEALTLGSSPEIPLYRTSYHTRVAFVP